MRHVLLLTILLALAWGVSAETHAATVISQDFESDLFVEGYEFSSTTEGIGDAATVGGLWLKGWTDPQNATVSTAQAHSGTKSISLYRTGAVGSPYGATLEVDTTYGAAPITGGQYAEVAWFYRGPAGQQVLMNDDHPTGESMAIEAGSDIYHRNISSFTYTGDGQYNGWEWVPVGTTIAPVNKWFALAAQIDLDAKTYNIWYKVEGSTWSKIGSNLGLQDRAYEIDELFFNLGTAAATNHAWIDDVKLETGLGSFLPGTLPGDATLNGSVDNEDLGALLSNLGSSGAYWEQGNFNTDAVVDNADLGILLSNLGVSLEGLVVSADNLDSEGVAMLAARGVTVVPEPSSLLLLAACLLGLTAFVWRKR